MKTCPLPLLFVTTLAAQVLNVDRLYQRPEFQDSQGTAISEPVFRAGEKNVLIVHGFNSAPADMRGLTDFLSVQCANVMLYKYPSGISPALSGRYLYQTLADMLDPRIRFDIVAYSEGGLVARAATEPSALNGGRAFGDRVENLVTIATPHEGLPSAVRGRDLLVILGLAAPVQAITDMLGGSQFLKALNDNPRQGATRYFAIIGNLFGGDDGLVLVDSAQGKNVLRTAGQAVLGLAHSDSLAAGRAMPNHADVYDAVKKWIIDGVPGPPECRNLDGNWNWRENATEHCVIGGQAEKPEPLRGSGTVPITQESGSCAFRYEVQDLVTQGPRIARNGVINGTNVTITGVAAAVLVNSSVTLTENTFHATGRVCGPKLTVTGQASFAGTVTGIPISCTYDTTAELTQLSALSGRFTSLPGASFSGTALSPGSIAAGFGSSLATLTQTAPGAPLPTTLGNTRVQIVDSAGTRRDAGLFFVSPSQINYLVPAETATGPARVEVLRGTQTVASGTLLVAPFAPGIFSASASGDGVAAAVVERVGSGGVRSSSLTFQYDTATRRNVAVPINLGPETDQVYVVLYGTGIRGSSSDRVIVTIDGERMPVIYAGVQPEFAGLDQINVGPLPRRLIGRGVVPVIVEIDGRLSSAVTLTFGAALGLPQFGPIQSFGLFPSALAVGDANGDGITDVVFGYYTGQVYLLAGSREGTFRNPAAVFRTATPNGIEIADFNRDGRADLMVIASGSTALEYAPGGAGGAFGAVQRIPVGPRLRSLYVRDLNADGAPDVILTSELNSNARGDEIIVLIGNGDGTFRPPQILSGGAGSQPFPLEFADMNGDGVPDIVAQNRAKRELMIFRGDRNGNYQATPQSVPIGATGALGGFAVADVDGDGLPDLIAAHGTSSIAVVLNSKTGVFQSPRQIAVADRGAIRSIVAGDFNRDGVTDFALSHDSPTGVSVVFGNRQGVFAAPKLIPTSEFAYGYLNRTGLFAVDLNRDGSLDIVAGREVLLGLGNGEFIPPQLLPVAIALLEIKDLNSDGALDLINGASTNAGDSFSLRLQAVSR
jgi:uncharacterized protein (TIGR03437 family)